MLQSISRVRAADCLVSPNQITKNRWADGDSLVIILALAGTSQEAPTSKRQSRWWEYVTNRREILLRSSEDILKVIIDYLDTTPLNRVEAQGIARIFEKPLVGVAFADDPLFLELKKPDVIGIGHMLPYEWLRGAKTVISYFLPFSEKIRTANYHGDLPATEWLYGRIEGELCNNGLRQHLIKEFGVAVNAVAPVSDPRFSVTNRRSNWSERHVAYIAGLGTFGLNKSFITENGCAGRFGSIVIDKYIKPTPKPYSGVYGNCNMCGECIDRCPSGAITMDGKNTSICEEYIKTQIKPRFSPRYGCGKCQTDVQCEKAIP